MGTWRWRSAVVGLLLGLLVACGGGGSDGANGGGPPLSSGGGGWITMDAPAETSTVCNEAGLSGQAFISPSWWHCCSGSAEELTGVSVTWRNETSGQAGAATQFVQIGSLFGTPYLSNHTWNARVPLAMGDNAIVVRASDPAGAWAETRVNIAKTGPSYDVSGQLGSLAGLGLGYLESGMSVALSGTRNLTAPASSGTHAGAYRFSCVPPGSYLVTPSSSAFAYAFSPSGIAFDVVNADVTGLDMRAPAQLVGGRISWAGSGAPSAQTRVTLSNLAGSLGSFTDSLGDYRFVVPDGNYAAVPSEPLCLTCSFSPSRRDISVQGADLVGLDFQRQ